MALPVMKFGPSINDVSSEGEGGGPPSKPIYYISLFSNPSQQGEGGGHKFAKMGRRRLWMAPMDHSKSATTRSEI